MDIALQIGIVVLTVLWLGLIGRLVLSLVFQFARDWRPKGLVALGAESFFTVTDPLIKPLRKLIPPITLGALRFDVAFIIAFVTVNVALAYLQGVAAQVG